MTARLARRGAGVAVVVAMCSACTHASSLLAKSGAPATAETSLGWFLLVVSLAVIAIITVLVPWSALRRRARTSDPASIAPDLRGDPASAAAEQRWMTGLGIALPAVILAAAFFFNLATMKAVASPREAYAATIQVTGRQWWWEITYQDSMTPSNAFATANEIHVPVGEPVRLELQTTDVIHAFWVPELGGKMETIPGRPSTMWLEASRPGVFSGPCSQYCGSQHAHMRVTVVAEPPATYRAWLASQRQSAALDAADTLVTAGRLAFQSAGCATCHTVRGTDAGGSVGPDLTHLASRLTLAAGALPNTPGNLMGWIADAQDIKPGCDMPRMMLAPHRMAALVAYLETLH